MERLESRTIVEHAAENGTYAMTEYLRVETKEGDLTWFYGRTGRPGKVEDEDLLKELEEEFQKMS